MICLNCLAGMHKSCQRHIPGMTCTCLHWFHEVKAAIEKEKLDKPKPS